MVGNTTKIARQARRLSRQRDAAARRSTSARVRTAGSRSSTATLTQIERLDYAIGTAESTVGALGNVGIELSPNDEISVLGLYTHVGEDDSLFANGYSETDGSEIDVSRAVSSSSARSRSRQLHGKHHLSRSAAPRAALAGQRRDHVARRARQPRPRSTRSTRAAASASTRTSPARASTSGRCSTTSSGGGGADVRMRVGSACSCSAGTMAQLVVARARRPPVPLPATSAPTPMVARASPAEDMFGAEHIGTDFQLEEGTLNEDAYTGLARHLRGLRDGARSSSTTSCARIGGAPLRARQPGRWRTAAATRSRASSARSRAPTTTCCRRPTSSTRRAPT